MRDKKFIKGEQQKVKKQKKELDAKINQDDGIARDRNGEIMCCVPFMKCTRVGMDLPKSLADGIKMCCTNPDCAYAKNLIHPECFRSLEQNLMTIITSKGYDKSLSEKLRISEERLWGKKGLALLQKNLRCACGKGQMTRDNDAWEEREKKLGPLVEEKEKKHKTKTTKLPTITAIVKDRPTPPQKLRELESHFLSRRTSPPDNFEDKYGPVKTKDVSGITSSCPPLYKQPPTFYKPPPTLVTRQSIPKPPVKKLPVGYAPVEFKPKPLEVIEEPPTAEEQENNFNNQGKITEMQWKELSTASPQQPSEASNALFPHHHFSYNSNPKLKNALVQTDETGFSAALTYESGLSLYNSKESFDSALCSVPRSWKDSDSHNTVNGVGNSGRSSVASYPHGIPYNTDERHDEFTNVSFVFLIDGRFGIEIDRNGTKKMLQSRFENELRPLFLSWVESIEIGETAEYNRRNFPKHVIYDILNIIGKPLYAIRVNPEWAFEVVDNNGGIAFEFETPNGLRRVPEETIMAAIFKIMKIEAEDYLNEDIDEICVSTNFAVTESQRNVFNKAALKLSLDIKLFNNI